MLYLPEMSCVPLTPDMQRLLEAAGKWPYVDLEQLRQSPAWEDAVAWGWVMASGELTGTGARHAGDISGGILRGD